MVNLHGTLFLAVAIYLLICALWGVVLAATHRPISPSYRGSLRLAELLILAQVVVGIIVFFMQQQHVFSLHYLYGLVIILALPAAEMLGVQWWKGRRETWVVALACLFAFGLAIRAAMTGFPLAGVH